MIKYASSDLSLAIQAFQYKIPSLHIGRVHLICCKSSPALFEASWLPDARDKYGSTLVGVQYSESAVLMFPNLTRSMAKSVVLMLSPTLVSDHKS